MAAHAWRESIFLIQKYEFLKKFTTFYTMIQTQFQKDIQILRYDNGAEFINT